MSVWARMFAPGRPLQLSLMFVGKARSLPSSGTHERCFTQVGPGVNLLQKSFIGSTPVANVIKLFMAESYDFS